MDTRSVTPASYPAGSFLAFDVASPLSYSVQQVDHTNLLNNGTNTHAQLDAFVASKSQANGLAPLDGAGKVPAANIPSATTAAIGGVVGVTSASTTALGSGAFNATATGSRNVAIAPSALAASTAASDNVAVGASALSSATTNGTNIAVGSNALKVHTGTPAVAVGHNALGKNTTGQYNTALGHQALANVVSTSGNTALGYQALTASTSTVNCTAVGTSALEKSLGGINTAVGYQSLFNSTTATNNTAVGTSAGLTLTTGARNTCIGNSADVNSASGADRIALGYNASATADGQMAIAPAITHIRAAGLGTAADGAGTLLAMDSSNNIRKAGGTTTTVAAIDAFVNSKGQASGLATLDAGGQVPSAQLGNAYKPSVTKGILTTGDGSASAMIAAGTDTQVLTADSTSATGLSYKQVDHVNLANKGTNTHAQIDAFISSKGAANGLATLDGNSKVPAAQLPDPTLTLPGALIGATGARQTVLGSDAAKNIFNDGVTYCTAIGTKALEAFTTDTVTLGAHTAVGDAALLSLTTGHNNTAVGMAAGNNLYTGNNNTFVGYNANTISTNCINSIALGSGSQVDSDGQFAIPTMVTHIKADGLATAADDSGTLLAVDASGYVRKAGGAGNTTVAAITASIAAKEDPSNKNVLNGYAGLDATAKVLPANLPSASVSALGVVFGVTSADTTALGSGVFNATATGTRNVALAPGALAASTSASDNVAIGASALAATTTGGTNVAIGSNALALHTGTPAVAVGHNALGKNTTGQYNTALGHQALANTVSTSSNTALGFQALTTATNTTNSTAVGTGSLEKCLSGTNTATGFRSLWNTTSGTNNTGLGVNAGLTVTTGSRNTCVGDGADTNSATATDRIALGNGAVATSNGQFALPSAITHLLMAGLGVHATNAPIPLTIDTSGIVRKAPTPFFSSVSLSADFTGSSTNLTTFNNWDVKIHDSPPGFGSSNSTWTCPRDARVLITFNFAFSCPAATIRYFQLVVVPVSTSNTPAPYNYNYGLDNYGGSYSFSASMQRALRQGDQLYWRWSMNNQNPAFQNTYTNWQISEIGPYPG